MSGYGFEAALPFEVDADWRDIDRAVAHWVLAHGGSQVLAQAAGWASHAEGQGETFWSVSDADLRARLAAEPMVGDGGNRVPFVLDGEHFMLWRFHAQQQVVARLVAERRAAASPSPLDEAVVDALFGHDRSAAVEAQRRAVVQVPGHRLFVLTGGPGTGKTTTVLRMLLGLLHHGGAARPTIRIAAPTGKAAQRLAQALRDGKRRLLEGGEALPPDLAALLPHIPDDEPLTLHRLLGVDGRSQRFRHHADDPLAADIVVVDEASMIDLALLRGLLQALRPEAQLILVGDPDQLSAVGAGAMLAGLVERLDAEGGEGLVRLHHSFRSGDALQPVLAAVRDGDPDAFARACADAGAAVDSRALDTAADLERVVADWAGALVAVWDEHGVIQPLDARDPGADAARRLQAMRAQQMLCARREGPFGSVALDARLEGPLRRRAGVSADAEWYPGRLVMVTRNDYVAGVFNGDVGLCLADAEGRLQVWFEAPGAADQPMARAFPPGLVPAHEGAFAITVHKSQGSEYGRCAIVLAGQPQDRPLPKGLLYTAISRARHSVLLLGRAPWGDKARG